jgi:hypothetical protein
MGERAQARLDREHATGTCSGSEVMSWVRVIGTCAGCGQDAKLVRRGQERRVRCGCPEPLAPAAFFAANMHLKPPTLL